MTATRETWRALCPEPELTAQEQQERHEMLEACRVQDGLWQYLEQRTRAENNTFPNPVQTWDGLVEWAAAHRQLQRAELRAWREWQERQGQAEQVEQLELPL